MRHQGPQCLVWEPQEMQTMPSPPPLSLLCYNPVVWAPTATPSPGPSHGSLPDSPVLPAATASVPFVKALLNATWPVCCATICSCVGVFFLRSEIWILTGASSRLKTFPPGVTVSAGLWQHRRMAGLEAMGSLGLSTYSGAPTLCQALGEAWEVQW